MDELLLLSKNDIPFKEARINIHQPTLRELSFIGEKALHIGNQFLNFSTDILSQQDKDSLGDKSDFEVFMSIMNSSEKMDYKDYALSVLMMIFPNYNVTVKENEILLQDRNNDFSTAITNENFNSFKEILIEMFCLSKSNSAKYNPADGLAAKIANKFKKAEEKRNKLKSESGELTDFNVYARYVSILSVGNHQSIDSLMDYTVYQIHDAFNRYQKKYEFDFNMQARLAGAQDLEEVDNWMDTLHSDSK